MLGAIAGDMIGSVYEHDPIKTKDFPLFQSHSRFTDDTVMTVAIAKAILAGGSYLEQVLQFGRRYPRAGYGGTFRHWLRSDDPLPYNSWGNGSAMRVSPVGFAFTRPEEALSQAAKTAEITHNHPEGIKGAQATALAVYLARTGVEKERIRARIEAEFDYDLSRSVDDIRPTYSFDVSCQGTVPEAIIAFLDADSYEDSVRNAVSLGGDADTLACIAGAIAEAFFDDIPDHILEQIQLHLPPDLWQVIDAFYQRFR